MGTCSPLQPWFQLSSLVFPRKDLKEIPFSSGSLKPPSYPPSTRSSCSLYGGRTPGQHIRPTAHGPTTSPRRRMRSKRQAQKSVLTHLCVAWLNPTVRSPSPQSSLLGTPTLSLSWGFPAPPEIQAVLGSRSRSPSGAPQVVQMLGQG